MKKKHSFPISYSSVFVWILIVGILVWLSFPFKPLRSHTPQNISSLSKKDVSFSDKQKISPKLNSSVQTMRQLVFEDEKKASQNSLLEPKLSKQDRMDKAMEQEFEMTMDLSIGDVPKERLKFAEQQIKQQFSLKAAIPGVSWQERGPNNIGGRTRALMYDPNDPTRRKVWAGGVAGGLWYNNDISSSNSVWKNIDDLWSNIAISTIAFSPASKQTFYVGTGEGMFSGSSIRGNGIWKSTNSGTSWTQLPSTANNPNFRYVNKIIVNSTGIIVAACASNSGHSAIGGLMRSTDGGTNWTSVLSGDFTDVELASNGDMYAGNRSGTVYKSTNQGQTWTNLNINSGGLRVELACAPSNAQVVYAIAYKSGASRKDIAWFKKTTNGGAIWSDLTIPLMVDNLGDFFTRGQAWYDLILQVHPNNQDIVFAGGVDLHKSIDGGVIWESVSHWFGGFGEPYVHADQHIIVFNDLNPNEMIFGNDGGVFISSNAGNSASPSFSARNNGYNITQYYAVAMQNVAFSDYFLAGSQDNGTHSINHPGIGSAQTVSGGDGMFCFIDQQDPNFQIASLYYNYYRLSTNGGNSFFTLINDQNSGRFINPADYDNNAKILYSAGNDNELKRIRNITTTPTTQETVVLALNNGRISAIKADAFTANRIFIGTGGGSIYRVENAHITPEITNITGTINSGYVSSIDIGATDDELLVTISNYGTKSVYYTSNGGTTWTSKDETAFALPDMPVRWGLFNPNNTKQVLLATDMGVWSTNDITASNPAWESTNQGLAHTRCDMLQYRSSDKLIAVATHGRGVFTSDVFSDPRALFQVNKTAGYLGSEFLFSDLSTKPTTWNWNFGSGANSSTANSKGPHTVTYSSAGKKSVSLTINGNKTYTQNNLITIIPNKNVEYLIANGGNFENDTDFYSEKVSTNLAFERGNSTVTGKNGVASGTNAWVTNLTGNYPNLAEARLYSPNFNLSAWGIYQISFKTKFKTEQDYDGFIVEYSTDKGITWTQLGNSVSANWYNSIKTDVSGSFEVETAFFSGTISNFETKSFDISFLAGNQNVAFRFVFRSDESLQDAGVAIDDFQITSGAFATAFDPTNNAENVPLNQNLTIFFNKNIQKGTGSLVIKRLNNNSIFETLNIANVNVQISGNSVVINPSKSFEDGTSYFVEMNSGALKDANNSTLPALSGNDKWQFATEITTHLEDDLLSRAIKIYPNPTTENIWIDSPENTFASLTLYVWDNNGKLIQESRWTNFSEKKEINLKNLPAGIYYFQLDNQKGKTTKKIIKK